MKKVLFVVVSVLLVSQVDAQSNLKMGHINFQELVLAMPETDSVKAKIEKITKDLQDTYQGMVDEYKAKKQDYDSKSNTYSDIVKKTKDTELADMEQRIKNMQQSAPDDLQKQRDNLYQPVLEKAKQAISEVGKENGFIYIFDISNGAIDYFSDNSIDVMPLVKKKLGLTFTKPTVPAGPSAKP